MRVAARGARVGTPCPAEPGAPRAAPALPPCGPHPLWAPEPLGCSSRGAREQELPALLRPAVRSQERADPAPASSLPPPPSCSHLRPLAPSPSRPGATAQTERGTAERERAPEDTELTLDCPFHPQVMSEVGRSQDLKSIWSLRIERPSAKASP